MAGIGVELLVVLFGTLLLVSGRGWRPINESQLLSFYQTGQWGESQSFTTSDNSNTFNSEDELIPEDAMPDFEGAVTSDRFDPFADHGFQEEVGDFGPRQWVSGSDGGFHVEFEGAATSDRLDPFADQEEVGNIQWVSGSDGGFQVEFDSAPDSVPSMRWTSGPTKQSSSGLTVVCGEDEFQITLPTDNLNGVKILGSKDLQPIMNAPGCGYEVNHLTNTLTVPFSGCNVIHADGHSLQLLYVDEFGQTQVATASCEENLNFNYGPRSNDKPKKKHNCPNPTATPTTGPTTGPSKAQNCAIATGERVTCGQSGISSADCLNMGCCLDSSTSACFYPMDECTGDQHFVFAIRYNSAAIQVDPTKLVIPGTNCKPVIVNDRVAIYKFKVTECGTKAYQVGETKIYLAEVQTIVQALNLKYGVITRTDPLRFMVECRYGKGGTPNKALASIGYMVITPDSDIPKSVVSNGLYGVQLKIAKDQTYSSYHPTRHQPLGLLLGKPIYLELNLKSPKPDAVILVNYCLAYPRSAKNALVLVYEGCANPYDPSVSILKVSNLPTNRHQRRFVVKAFQFMDQKTNKYLDEEIYFMCSAEVCRPKEKTCEERCFDGKTP